MKVVIASFNEGKIKEFRHLFKDSNYELVSLGEFSKKDIKEIGLSYEENSLIKAKEASKITKLPALADDSGLEVRSLNGNPGLYSARFAGEKASDESNNKKLLKKLLNKPDRKAKFIASLAFVDTKKEIELFSFGELEGEITTKESGENGFGYDPLFKIKNLSKTLSEISFQERMVFSHRAKATRRMIKYLDSVYK